MASFNSMLFLTLLVAISALMAVPYSVEAGVEDNYVNVTGNVRCALNTTILPNGSLSGIPFPNATVELRCGSSNTTVASNTTNANGTFVIVLDTLRESILQTLLLQARTVKNCSAVVTTPLSICNSNLTANGTLVSPLTKGPIKRDGDIRMFLIYALSFVFSAQPM